MTISVAHVTNLFSAPSETFILGRVLNPICERPIPVLARQLIPNSINKECLKIYATNKLEWLNSHFDDHCQHTFHMSPYFFQVLQKIRPQLIHAHFANAAQQVLFASKSLHIPLLANFYGYETKRIIHDPRLRSALLRLCSQVDHITCVSQSMVDDLLQYGCSEKKITLIRNGIDTDFFSGNPRIWYPDNVLRLIIIARLHPEKGYIFLLNALQMLNHQGFRNWTLHIIGTGNLESELKAYCQKAGMNNQITFLGTQTPEEVSNELRQAHIMILPSLKETQGIVLQEAQACGTPVISTRVGGIPEGVIDKQTGFLIPPGESEELLRVLLRFIHNPGLITQMGAAGQSYVRDHFSKNTEYKQLANLYREVLDKYKMKSPSQSIVNKIIRTR